MGRTTTSVHITSTGPTQFWIVRCEEVASSADAAKEGVDQTAICRDVARKLVGLSRSEKSLIYFVFF